MKSSYRTETHNETEKNYHYNYKKEEKKIFLAVNVSVFQPFRSFIVIIINSNYMDSQFSDIRKEYKKGKLTRNTISENPFEQFARWLNDALHCGENEPTAMIIATVSPDGRPSTRTVLLKGVEMVNSSSSPTTKAVRDGNSQPIPTSPSLSFGISWKDKYILKGKQRNALLKNRTLTSPPDPTKAGSAQEYPPKVTSSAAGWK